MMWPLDNLCFLPSKLNAVFLSFMLFSSFLHTSHAVKDVDLYRLEHQSPNAMQFVMNTASILKRHNKQYIYDKTCRIVNSNQRGVNDCKIFF